ncbi:Phage-related minor tail protein [uncultured Clostridium sp.]|uniref:tape measure protein n=1 Tax=uncultured Clostridium sp. TaxID=59620 RepID=UPI000823481C|nr:tape measure protein [uncultured Clostridium sp.]SCJ00153.1 Phage-related minor tail protein [uncultured Clostridium sp.]
MDAFKLSSSIELNINDVMKGLDKIDSKSKSTDKSLDSINKTSKNTSNGLSKLGDIGKKGLAKIDDWAKKGAIAIGTLATGMLALGIKTNASLETSTTSWTTLLGTQEQAKSMIEDITNYAAKTPFSKMGVDEMAKQLHNAGFAGDDLFNQLTKFGNMGSAFGIQEDSLKEMVRQYGQVQMAGYAYTEDLNILQDRGIPIYKALSETLGIAVGDVKKMASEGKLTTEIYNEALNSISGTTEGAMDAQSKTFSGMLSTIKDGVVNITQKVIQPLFDKIVDYMPLVIEVMDTFTSNLDSGKGIMDSMKDAIASVFGEDTLNKINSVINVIKILVGTYVTLKAVMTIANVVNALSSAYGVLSGLMTANTAVTAGATVTQTGLNLAFLASPITWIIAGITAVIAIFVLLWNKCEGFRNFWINLWETIKTAFGMAKDWVVNGVTDLVSSATNKFNELKEGLTKPINWAKDKIKGVIDSIKSFFKFEWSLPKIKLPHLSIRGSFSLLPPSVPKFGIEWYANGGIMTQPTMFGMNGNKAMVGGEAGAEAVLPLEPFYNYMDSKLDSIANRTIVIEIDGREFMRAVAGNQDEFDRYNTRNPKLAYR